MYYYRLSYYLLIYLDLNDLTDVFNVFNLHCFKLYFKLNEKVHKMEIQNSLIFFNY
jgi:hypothetical protein